MESPRTLINKKSTLQKKAKEKPFTVVAIGASAGGLEAVSILLKKLPPDTGMAFIYVQHLSPDHKSLLTSLLSKVTKMKVQEIEDMEHMAPNNLYVMPPNKEIEVIDGHIQLLPRPKNSAANLSIDVLFSSLAETHKANVIGVVLSGYGSDGMIGLKDIKAAEGITFAQDNSAQASSMPNSAIASGVVDYILSPEEIAHELVRLSKNGFLKHPVKEKQKEFTIENNNFDLNTIFELLLKETGVDFSHYKMPTIKRRINHKMQQSGVKTIKEYVKLLLKKNNEINLLYKDLLINVTSFFREAEALQYLKTSIFPKLLKSKTTEETLRIWVPACSTGQEAYSIAMILSELQENKIKKIPVQIFATDLSERAILDARIGEYSQSDVKSAPEKYLKHFFTKVGDKYRIVKELREMCVFAPHNILRDPPFSRMDFVSCCNLLIYFDSAAQKKVFATVYFALKEGGYLMLAKAESIGASSQLFTPINNEFKIYSRKNNMGGVRKILELTPRFTRTNMSIKKPSPASKNINANPAGIENVIDSVLLSNYMPACAVVNKDMEILQFRGPVASYLEHPSGKASLNILKMARPEFAFELRNAINKVIKTKKSVYKSGIEIKIDSVLRMMSFEVCPLKIEWDEPLLLIVFKPLEQVEKFIENDKGGKNISTLKDLKIKNLTEELNNTRTEMITIIESQETTYEELQAAKEEIVSSNEEFQSLNEELETSKEEIEATNEELITTNQELQMRNELLTESQQYSEAIIATIHEPMLILNKDLHVKSANKSFYKKFHVEKEETEGILLFDLGNKQWNIPKLRKVLNDILSKNISFENLEVTHTFPGIGEKIMLLNAHLIVQKANSEQLILLAIEDITERSRYHLKEKYSLSLIEASLDPLVTISTEGKITDMNEALVNITGMTRKELTGSDFFDYFTEPQKAREVYQEVFAKGSVADSPLTLRHKDGKLTDVLFNGSVYKDGKGNVLGVVIVARDVTAQKLLSKYSLSLIEASLDPLVTISPEGKITDMNEALVNITGMTREELTGSDFFDYFTEPQKAREVYQEVFAKGSVADSPLTLHHKEGKLTDVLFNGSVYKDDRGNVLGVVIVARDVTAQKLLSKYSLSLIEASLDPLVTISTEGKIMDMNEALVNITGMTREELTGSDFFDYFTEPQKAREVYQEVFAKGSVADSPLTLHHKEGKLTDVLFNGSVYKDDRGNVLGVVIVARDVTAQKLLSKYSLSLIEASLDPLVTISTEGKIMDMNEALVNITGMTREELTGSDFFDYFTEPQKAREVYQEVFAKGSVADSPLTLHHKEGKLTDVLFNGSVYKDDRGNVLGVVIVARDVTDQKRIATELTEAKVFAELATLIAEEAKSKAESATRIAEDAVKSKQQFLSNMSHEIRTPMNAIIGFTKVVLKTDLSASQKEYLSAIKTSGDALIVLINDILDLAKVNAGKMTFEQTPFKMAVSISSMLHLFETKIQEKNLKLVKDYDKRIPIYLVGDSIRLHQIILNLVSNAVKFTTKGKITVSVHLLNEDEECATIEFTITDTGIGIAKNKIETIFENFQQASSGTSRLFGGTGLGLAIVKQLVEAQGGTVRVKSKIDEGSTFSFTLPFLKTKVSSDSDSSREETGLVNPEIRNIKVLVVEDIVLNQLLMKTLLDDFGFERDIADNGKIALEKLQNKSYDIILMDLQMPEMDGFETTEYIRNTMHSKIPIIALTADVTTMDLAKCKAVGMDDYIAKPVDERLLYSKIVGLVQKPILKNPNEQNKGGNNESGSEKIKYTDLKYLNQRTKSNPTLIMEMISLYLKQTPPLISAMKQSLQDKDWDLLQKTVHKMIPSFSIMGISPVYENMAKKIQECLSTKEPIDDLDDLVLQLENVCAQACEELEEELIILKTLTHKKRK